MHRELLLVHNHCNYFNDTDFQNHCNYFNDTDFPTESDIPVTLYNVGPYCICLVDAGVLRFSFGSGDWRAGADSQLLYIDMSFRNGNISLQISPN